MYWLVALMTFAVLGLILLGLMLEFRPRLVTHARPWYKPAMATQLVVFVAAQLGLLVFGINDVFAVETGAEGVAAAGELSVGMGLAIIGAGIAVGPIGAASLAAITEKPENLGRTLIYLGLAEGIAIYGLVISILLLNRI
jgi:V/A-type H+-transporting ATPase subunit K